MISLGLTSVTFRNLTVDEIINLVKRTDIDNIEWGGDIHVKDEDDAVYVYNSCRSNGIRCCSYGSYYKAGTYGSDYMAEFEKTAKTALRLHCDTIRIWAYDKSSYDVQRNGPEYQRILEEMQNISEYSEKSGLSISFEHHQKTLTDDTDNALKLIEDIGRKNVYLYWQAQVKLDFEENKKTLNLFKPYLKNIHISNQLQNGYLLLNEMYSQLSEYIDIVKGSDTVALIEFVKDGKIESYEDDIEVLRKIVKKNNG